MANRNADTGGALHTTMENIRQNGSPESDLETVPFDARQAILCNTNMTKDLEEQISNVEIVEHILRRPSDISAEEMFCSSSKRVLNVTPVSMRSNHIEPIPNLSAGISNPNLRKNFQRRETIGSQSTGPQANRNHPLNRYMSLLGEVDPLKRTKGSLTSSDEGPENSPENIDPVSFSANGTAIICNATQTPEDMNSSDDDHTDEETGFLGEELVGDLEITRQSSESTGDSTSETEEWDSEADTHTSPSDDDDTEKKPITSYYKVEEPTRRTTNKGTNASRNQNGNGRSLKDQFMASLPWIPRPAFTSMQFPSTQASNHPRHASHIPSSQSFPQDFFHMVSNPFFTTSLHDAYRQACAFKEWYETHFPDQAGLATTPGLAEKGIHTHVNGHQPRHFSSQNTVRPTQNSNPQAKRYSK